MMPIVTRDLLNIFARSVPAACAGSAILFLTACAVGENYHKPPVKLEKQWNALRFSDSNITAGKPYRTGPWWKQFNDDELVILIEVALINNNDLKIAEARITEARANEKGTTAALLPKVDATGSISRQTVNVSSGKATDTLSQGGVRGNWDIDVFGGGRRRDEAAAAGVEAAIAERDRTRLFLIAEVARNYVELRSGQKQYDITLKNLDMQRHTFEGTQEQRKEGDVTELEVVRAKAQADATAARLLQIKTAIFAAANRLSVLTGQPVSTLEPLLTEPGTIPSVPQQNIVVTPIKTIATRPDVRTAERQLAQATALSGAAFAQFFPSLSLEGFFGAQHSNLYSHVSPWSAAVSSLFPLLDFGRISSQVDMADARQQQALLQYQQTVLLALEETENALMAYINEQKRLETLTAVADAQTKAAEIASEQYKAGFATQLDLLVAEGNQLDAQTAMAISEATVMENLILLYRALGEDTSKE